MDGLGGTWYDPGGWVTDISWRMGDTNEDDRGPKEVPDALE
jgi:hypothetical protein